MFGWIVTDVRVQDLGLEGGSVRGGSYTGALVGRNGTEFGDAGKIANCYATLSVTGTSYVGGLTGYGGGISNSYATGAVMGNDYCVGGLIGYGGGISNCHATGAVTGTSFNVGGLIGSGGSASDSYATGAVTGTSSVGGLVGGSIGAVTASYWDKETSGRSSSSGGTGLTTVQMKQQASFSGWNFTSTWAISGGYPYLVGLTKCRLTYKAGENGQIGDGLTTVTATGSSLAQVINLAAASTPVKAMAGTGYRFDQWSDGSTANPRTDSGLTSDTTLTAKFALPAAAADWRAYR